MIPNFNKAFKSTPTAEKTIPKAVMEYLNSTAPTGTRYIQDKDGGITLIADGKPFTISGFTLEIPKSIKKQVESFSKDEFNQFVYNAQMELKVNLNKDGYIIINGEELPVEALHRNIYNPIKQKNMQFFLMPESFPEVPDIKIASDKYTRILKMKRYPYASLTEKHFESEDGKSLKLKLTMDDKKESSHIQLTYNLNCAKSVQEIVESVEIFNAFIDGKGYLMGEKIPSDAFPDNSKDKFDKRTLDFWKKVLEVETALKLSFVPTKDSQKAETIYNIEKLYQTIILKKPIREEHKITSISSEWNAESTNRIKDSIGKPMYFQYTGDLKFNIMGQEFKCPSIFGKFNCKLADVKVADDKTTLFFADESDDKTGYTSVLSFATEKELDAYGHVEKYNHANDLKDAQTIQTILSKN